MNHLIAPSILAADFINLAKDINLVNESQADWFHLDVMDGVFVPNISFGIPVIKAIKSKANKPLDVHLMIVNPEKYTEAFCKAGADILTVHYEACPHLHRNLQEIRSYGMKAGVAINPHTPISALEDIIEMADVVCLMSVNPGFGGQQFIENSLNKIVQLKELIIRKNTHTYIEVDGGVGADNIRQVLKAGADVLVAGSSVFGSDNPTETIASFKNFKTNTLQA